MSFVLLPGFLTTIYKFGDCKFQDRCKRRHFSSEFEDLDDGKNIKSYQNRHPKKCKNYASTSCRFEKSCAYKHKNPTPNIYHELLNEKVAMLEKVIDAMTQKVLSLEIEIEQLKTKMILPKVTENPSRIRVHEIKSKSQVSEEKSRIRETKHLSTNADSSTDTTVGWTKNTQKTEFFEKRKKSSKTQKLKNV